MLMPQINQSYSIHNLTPLRKPLVDGATKHYSTRSSYYSSAIFRKPTSAKTFNPTRAQSTSADPISVPISGVTTTRVEGVIKIQPKVSTTLHSAMEGVLDILPDFWQKPFSLELVSNKGGMRPVKADAKRAIFNPHLYTYYCHFQVPANFGDIGAVLVENKHHTKMFVKSISLDNGVTFICDAWVHSIHDKGEPRIFFTNKSYLPSETPNGITRTRLMDLADIRGNGEGERKYFERIYDYDVYNDLGNPSDNELDRPVLGGDKLPYPRRCRTGRKLIDTPLGQAEARWIAYPYYVPMDEDFSEIKQAQFGAKTLYSLLHEVVPSLESIWPDKDDGFSLFTDIHSLYNEGVNLPIPHSGILSILPGLIRSVLGTANALLKFETPRTIERDSFSWLSDEEFCRQMLAGTNPCSIQLVTEWPLKSKLDPEIYGPPESAITEEIVEKEIKGFMTFDQALVQKKLFMLDYHDLLLPYVTKTREQEGTTLYGSRTLMFLTPAGTLMPIAIELTRPKSALKSEWKHVYTPTTDATNAWLWKLAKAHVLAHDSGFHQLVSHWLRTHCATEPYIISTHRNLSQMHPIYRLLIPYFRYTLQINALARQLLVNAGGVIESTFSTGKYSMQLSSDAYHQLWRFDHEALPADLIRRGMAVEDQNEQHGLKLTIEDYPFANDGLLLWDAIKEWTTSYVKQYYKQENLVESDEELQAWWDEIRTVGHGDKKDEPWWPQLKTKDDLIKIVSTIIWVTSGYHSAVNFGQYDFAGYFPNRPTIARTKMPNEDNEDEEWKSFIKRPEATLLKCLPSKHQALTVMLTMNVLSAHSPDEMYIGRDIEEAWKVEPTIEEAFKKFSGRLKEIEEIIDTRNANPELRNRSGAGLVPYQLLKPFSVASGVTGMGVPNSISI